MATPKKYSHDRIILLLLSTDLFVGIVASLVMGIRLLSSHATGYIVQYRSSLGLNAFKAGSIYNLVSFIGFFLLVTLGAFVLSKRAYPIRRHLALSILSLSLVLLLFGIFAGNALLGLR